MSKFKEQMQEYFIDGTLQSKPHWGKYIPADINYAKMYGKNFTQFNDTLKNWYSDHGLKLENSMLLNSFFCQILKLPYAPAVVQQLDLSKRSCRTVADASDIAGKLCALIEGDNVHAHNLRKRLQAIAANNVKDNKCTLFRPACFGQTETVNDKEEEQSHSCAIV